MPAVARAACRLEKRHPDIEKLFWDMLLVMGYPGDFPFRYDSVKLSISRYKYKLG